MGIIEITYIICFFCIGTLFGSFFSLAIYRLPRKQDIMIKRSYCPSCKHNLKFIDLVPVFSYIYRLGKCKYCGGKISPRYLILELANGTMFTAIYLIFGISALTYLILGIYILLFLVVGSFIMKNKMSTEEILEVKTSSINSKKGVFNIELLIAMFAFAIYFTAAIYMTRNYRDILLLANLRSLAFNISSNNLETSKSLVYDNVVNVNSAEVSANNYGFTSEIIVKEYVYDSLGDNEIYSKKITSKVSYVYGDKTYEVILEDIKQKRGAV